MLNLSTLCPKNYPVEYPVECLFHIQRTNDFGRVCSGSVHNIEKPSTVVLKKECLPGIKPVFVLDELGKVLQVTSGQDLGHYFEVQV